MTAHRGFPPSGLRHFALDLPKEAVQGRAGLARWRERMGFLPPSERPSAVFYCDGIGEIRTAVPLLARLSGSMGSLEPVVMVYGKDAYRHLQRASLPVPARIVYSPYYSLEAARRSFARLGAAFLVIVESDYAPVYLDAAKTLGAGTAVLNVSLSHWKDEHRHGLGPEDFRRMLSACDLVTFKHASVRGAVLDGQDGSFRTAITGNLRYAIAAGRKTLSDDRFGSLLGKAAGQSLLFVAGSTYEEEETMLLEAFGVFLRSGRWKLILAPMKSWRASRSLRLAASAGFACARRSRLEGLSDLPPVTVLDTMGELAAVYGYGHAAFVGGTIRRKGGHNLFEPAACGLPVLFGPDYRNNFDFAAELIASGGGKCVRSAAQVRAQAARWLEDPDTRAREGAAAAGCIGKGADVLEKTVSALERLFGTREAARTHAGHEHSPHPA